MDNFWWARCEFRDSEIWEISSSSTKITEVKAEIVVVVHSLTLIVIRSWLMLSIFYLLH